MKLRIGTDETALALWQAHYTQQELLRIGVDSALHIYENEGTTTHSMDLGALENALLGGEVDVVVRSMKELPTTIPDGLVITAVSRREKPNDLLLIKKSSVDLSQAFRICKNAIIGISTACQKAQILAFRPDSTTKDLMGDLATSLEKLKTQDLDALIWAASDVVQLGLDVSEFECLDLYPKEFVPVPAQGVLAWQANEKDFPTRRIFKMLHNPDVAKTTNIERRVMQLMENEKQLPLGVYCEMDSQAWYHVTAACSLHDNLQFVQLSASTNLDLAERVVEKLNASVLS